MKLLTYEHARALNLAPAPFIPAPGRDGGIAKLIDARRYVRALQAEGPVSTSYIRRGLAGSGVDIYGVELFDHHHMVRL